jgi:heat shock protein HtpX
MRWAGVYFGIGWEVDDVMVRRIPGADKGLMTRMGIVMFLLVVLYAVFSIVLFVLLKSIVLIIVIDVVFLLAQYWFSDKLALLSMGAKEVTPAQRPELHGMVERLAQQMNLPKPRIYEANTDIPNAFATGRNPSHAVLCVTTGIQQRLNGEEMEAVIGHEMTHVKNRDVMVITFASFFATVAASLMRLIFWMGLFGGFGGGGRGRDRDNGASAIMLVYLASLVVWVISFFLIRALSRYRELAAERGSAIVTGAPSHLASALTKISSGMARIPDKDLRSTESLNAFFIVPALAGGASIGSLFSTHPSLQKRLAQLEKIQAEMYGIH